MMCHRYQIHLATKQMIESMLEIHVLESLVFLFANHTDNYANFNVDLIANSLTILAVIPIFGQ